MFGMDRFKQKAIEERYKAVGETAGECMKAFDTLLEFNLLLLALLTSTVEIENNAKKCKIKTSIRNAGDRLQKFIERVGAASGMAGYEKYYEKLLAYNDSRPRYIEYCEKEHEELANYTELAISTQLALATFGIVTNKMSVRDKQDYIKFMDMITVACYNIKQKIEVEKPKPVSKYQKYVGVNLKNWNKK